MTAKLPSAELMRELHRECFHAEANDKTYVMVQWQKIRALLHALDKAERLVLRMSDDD